MPHNGAAAEIPHKPRKFMQVCGIPVRASNGAGKSRFQTASKAFRPKETHAVAEILPQTPHPNPPTDRQAGYVARRRTRFQNDCKQRGRLKTAVCTTGRVCRPSDARVFKMPANKEAV
ncbi:hypothetical protein [Kingella potus]|uniref:hypothetical protein n=1 Tax=Kingella potus TaxID=265175 RepID=UPI001FD213A6|nr:hypothetical protein [Kingella potus]UOP01692.1 hypothetical protein LVJ84_06055 [Kingella potus]